jgi:hypothetical protein
MEIHVSGSENPARPGPRPPRVDTARAYPARVYDYLLGGKDNFAKDRAAAEKMAEVFPAIRIGARENRKFRLRGVGYLAAKAGVRQFLDVGTGIPTPPDLHEIVQAYTPSARIVYVDNDPIVMTHARALMASHRDGEVAYLDADLREPESIVDSALVRDVFDLSQPIALVMTAVLHFITDEENPAKILQTFINALPPGSYVLASHITDEHDPRIRSASNGYDSDGVRTQGRTAKEFEQLVFTGQGLQLIEPGVVLVSEWHRDPDDLPVPSPAAVSAYGGLALRT